MLSASNKKFRTKKESNMAVTKAKKAEQIEKLSTELKKASSMIVGTFSKLTVAKDYELRKTVRAAGGRYQVFKNTLAKPASDVTTVPHALKTLTLHTPT